VAKLRAAGRPVTLTLAGDGEESASLKAQVEQLGLGDAVRFIGHVKARYGFSKGSLLVVPSRGDSMPYVVIEAAAAGIPMVAANFGGIPRFFARMAIACALPATPAPWPMRSKLRWKDPAAAEGSGQIATRAHLSWPFSQKANGRGRHLPLPRTLFLPNR
jgi:glycosyltransferase involved in cell wall biosynthesis